MDEFKNPQLEEVQKILVKLKPPLKIARQPASGSRLVKHSFFTFSQTGYYYWIVLLCEDTFAFKRITPYWIKTYSGLVLSSQTVYVEYDINHYITDWYVEESKICDDYRESKTPAV